jgi:hypothetical protein
LNYEQIRINHSGGFLPLLIGALGTLIGEGTAIANSIIEANRKKAEEEEIKIHNLEMEKIAKNEQSLSIRSGFKKEEVKPVTNFYILKLTKKILK